MSRVKIYDCPGESVLSYAVFTLLMTRWLFVSTRNTTRIVWTLIRYVTLHFPAEITVLNIKPIWYGLSANSKATWYNLNIVLNIWYKTRGHQCLMFRKPVGKSSPLHYEFVLIKIITIMNLYSGNSIQFSNALLIKITQWSSAQVFETSVNVINSVLFKNYHYQQNHQHYDYFDYHVITRCFQWHIN